MSDHTHDAEPPHPTPGWQEPALPPRPPRCPHFGLLFAQLSVARHAEGHKWVCTCGQVFRMVSNGGRDKRLVKDWKS